MSEFSIDSNVSLDGLSSDVKIKDTPVGDFLNILKSNINDTSQLLNAADTKVKDYSISKTGDVHEIMIAVEEANLALNYTMQVRNKIIEAYQEMMRIQV